MKGKLVRDKIPSIIEKSDRKKPHIRVLSKKEFKKELRRKLIEEASEVAAAKENIEIALEMADIEEVLSALRTANAISKAKVITLQKEKKKQRGGFNKRIFLLE